MWKKSSAVNTFGIYCACLSVSFDIDSLSLILSSRLLVHFIQFPNAGVCIVFPFKIMAEIEPALPGIY